MQQVALDFLKALMETPSPSGFEQPAQRVVREYMKSFADEVRTDVHGNVIGCVNPKGKIRVMLAGHIDEIGLMITHIDEQGYLFFGSVGGVDTSVLPGSRVEIHTDSGIVKGIIGRKPIHLLSPDERKRAPKMTELWVDIGAKDGKEAKKYVAVGDVITVESNFEMLLNDIAVSRGFDDRIGAFIVTEALRQLSKKKKLNVAVFAVSTVQEEVGLRGARTSAYSVDPHAGIAVDVGFASDYPGVDKKLVGTANLGDGPMLYKGANINPVLGEMLLGTARKKRIPHQFIAEPRATGTDANAIQVTRGGVAAGLISVPNRYMHTPVEVVSLKDVENCIKLIVDTLVGMKANTSFIPE